MSESVINPTLEQINKKPTVAAINGNQKLDLVHIEEASKVVQETHEDLVKTYQGFGMPPNMARSKAEIPITTLTSDVMDKEVNEALADGTDGYAIMAAIHRGAEEGRSKSKMGSFKRIIYELYRRVVPQ